MLRLILGGARSGKSRLAQDLAGRAEAVVYIATAQPNEDDEMIRRIEQHRRSRPASWKTVEEQLDLAGAVETAASNCGAVIADCLTVWLSNLFWRYREGTRQQIEACFHAQLARIKGASARCEISLVSNEVGCGTVPEPEVTREFRDAQGRLNQYAARLADEVIFTVAGLPLYLKTARSGGQ